MKKIRVASYGVLVFAAIVFILLNNKKHMAAKSVPDIQLNVPVRVQEVSERTLSEPLALVGEISGENDVTVVAEAEGRVTRVHVEVGEAVKAGQSLFQIDDEIKRAEFERADVNLEKAKRDHERYNVLKTEGSASESQLEGARLALKAAEAAYTIAKRQVEDTQVRSPISGVVTARPVNVGTRVKFGDVMANVVQIAKLKTRVQVAERDVFKLKVGDAVTMKTDVYPEAVVPGRIATISDKADAAHTFAVEITCDNPQEQPLKAGMFARVLFNLSAASPTLAVPRESLTGSLRDPHVYVIDNSVATLRHVVIEEEVNGWLVVSSGLRQGEKVVVSGQNNLRDGATVTVQ